MSIKKGIGFSPVTDKIYIGKQNTEKGLWVGEKENITNDFLNVLFEYIPATSFRSVNSKNGAESNIIINVKRDIESIELIIKHLQSIIIDMGEV